MAHIMANS